MGVKYTRVLKTQTNDIYNFGVEGDSRYVALESYTYNLGGQFDDVREAAFDAYSKSVNNEAELGTLSDDYTTTYAYLTQYNIDRDEYYVNEFIDTYSYTSQAYQYAIAAYDYAERAYDYTDYAYNVLSTYILDIHTDLGNLNTRASNIEIKNDEIEQNINTYVSENNLEHDKLYGCVDYLNLNKIGLEGGSSYAMTGPLDLGGNGFLNATYLRNEPNAYFNIKSSVKIENNDDELNPSESNLYVDSKAVITTAEIGDITANNVTVSTLLQAAKVQEGNGSVAQGNYSHAEGNGSIAVGNYSHAEGNATNAGNQFSHAEGSNTIANGISSHAEGYDTKALKESAHAEGQHSTADGNGAHAEGWSTSATGNFSHAEGVFTKATKDCAHAEGTRTEATENDAHAEGSLTLASGVSSHAEGYYTEATASESHAEGNTTHANGISSHAEGIKTKTVNEGTHAEGYETQAIYAYSHSEGNTTTAIGKGSHVEGYGERYITTIDILSKTKPVQGDNSITKYIVSLLSDTSYLKIGSIIYATNSLTFNENKLNQIIDVGKDSFSQATYFVVYGNSELPQESVSVTIIRGASGSKSHAEGSKTNSLAECSHTEGIETFVSTYSDASHAEGYQTIILNIASNEIETGVDRGSIGAHAEGYQTTVYDYSNGAHAEGYRTKAEGIGAHAEGIDTVVSYNGAHAEGCRTNATASYSHAEGCQTEATFKNAHAEGKGTKSTADSSHAEGIGTIASAEASHSEGLSTKATLYYAHAEGESTTAEGIASHAEGEDTVATGNYSHAEGLQSKSIAEASHAEGYDTEASGDYSHVEGYESAADGNYSHAEGNNTQTFGDYSHAEGYYTQTNNQAEHAEGKYNLSNKGVIYEKTIEYTSESSNNTFSAIYHVDVDNDRGYYQIDHDLCIGCGNCVSVCGENAITQTEDGKYDINKHDCTLCERCVSKCVLKYVYKTTSRTSADLSTIHSIGTGHIGRAPRGGVAPIIRKNSVELLNNGQLYLENVGGFNGTNAYESDSVNKILQKCFDGGDIDTTGASNATTLGLWDKTSTRNKGKVSFAEGYDTEASGDYSHAEGSFTKSSGNSSHAEGYSTIASNDFSHAEGIDTRATGKYSHAEGRQTQATEQGAHAEGLASVATKQGTHAEGLQTHATGDGAHAEGNNTYASGTFSHAEGYQTKANNDNAHTEGSNTKATGICSHAEGDSTQAQGECSHAEGCNTIARGKWSHIEGIDDVNTTQIFRAGLYSSTLTTQYFVEANPSTSEGSAFQTHCQNGGLISLLDSSNNSLYITTVQRIQYVSFMGGFRMAIHTGDDYSPIIARNVRGVCVLITGALGDGSHVEGYKNLTMGNYSHAEGQETIAKGIASHAAGIGTIADNNAMTVVGKYNKPGVSNALFVVGGGTNSTDANRKNALTVTNNGIENTSIASTCALNGSTVRTTFNEGITVNKDSSFSRSIANPISPISSGQNALGINGTNPYLSTTGYASSGGLVSKTLIYTNQMGSNIEAQSHVWDESSSKAKLYKLNLVTATSDQAILKSTKYQSNGSITESAEISVGSSSSSLKINIGTFGVGSPTISIGKSDSTVKIKGSTYPSISSDIRLKNVVSNDIDLDKAYEMIDKCQTIIYTFKDDPTAKEQIGLIAQEVQEFFPEIVYENDEGYLSLDYGRITVILMKVMKSIIDRIKALESK